MSETLRLLKRFALVSLLLLCVVAMACGAALVDTNTRFLTLGEPGRQVAFAMDRTTTTLMVDRLSIALPPMSAKFFISAFSFLICI